ncbi:hypothetical protein AOLI_G00230590, partial [Acnodon oligacanthus]
MRWDMLQTREQSVQCHPTMPRRHSETSVLILSLLSLLTALAPVNLHGVFFPKYFVNKLFETNMLCVLFGDYLCSSSVR